MQAWECENWCDWCGTHCPAEPASHHEQHARWLSLASKSKASPRAHTSAMHRALHAGLRTHHHVPCPAGPAAVSTLDEQCSPAGMRSHPATPC